MEVILKEDVVNLGHRGDVVKVADGYGRNFLLPRKLALQATAANKAVIEQMKASAARRSATYRSPPRPSTARSRTPRTCTRSSTLRAESRPPTRPG